MHHQIFIPGSPGKYTEKLCEAGLASHVNGAMWQDLPNGPGKQDGVLYAWPNPEHPEHVYQPDKQTWLPAVPWEKQTADRYYVGFWNDSPPTPADLEGVSGLMGYRTTLGDGNDWLVPTAQFLPADMQLTADGPARELKHCYWQFWETSEKWFGRLQAADFNPSQIAADDAAWWEFLLEALTLVYPRLLPEVASYLRLFDQTSCQACLLAVCDHEKIMEVLAEREQKKTETNDSPTPAG